MEIYNSRDKQKVIADKYGIKSQEVSSIKTGKTWSWLTGAVYHRKTKYTENQEQRRSVRNLPNPPKGEFNFRGNRKEGYADYQVGRVYVSPYEILTSRSIV